MRFQLTEEQLTWQQEIREFLREIITPELLLEAEVNQGKTQVH
ncbi:hypothetical protein [Bacillus sp. OTU2372]